MNVLYKCLEIEIDGVFKSLLLLKKKKYAALNVENFGTPYEKVVKEVKGLDMVRRDWCNLSKEVGNFVLEEILSGKDREKIVVELNNYLSDIGENWILQGRGVKLISRASKDLSQSHSGLGIKLPCLINAGKTKFVNM